MYTRFVLFTLGKGKRDIAKDVAGRFENAMKDLNGYKGSTFIADEKVGEYGVLSMWETVQDAKKADASLAPDFIKSLLGQVQRAPIRRILEVFQP
jgi:heme-degrading monooxygenase HmoA